MKVVLVLGIINTIISAIVCPIIAYRKGRNVIAWVFGGLFLSLIGIVVVSCLPEKY